MLIIETPIFTKRLQQVLDDEDYRVLQVGLTTSPDMGQVIPGSGGIRKLRWSVRGRGKRGGARIIYRWFAEHNRLLMLFILLKNERADLSAQQLKVLRRVVRNEFR